MNKSSKQSLANQSPILGTARKPMSPMNRFRQILLIGSFLPLCWLAFMATHELGHVLAAFATGGTINKVVIHPLTISRTDVSPNPSPGVVSWAGPVLGVALPLGVWIVYRKLKLSGEYLLRFFVGFCLIANGAYIAFGSLGGIGDAGEMLRQGYGRWLLWLFGVATIPIGLLLWNGLGSSFGLDKSNNEVSGKAAITSFVLFVSVFALTSLLSPRF